MKHLLHRLFGSAPVTVKVLWSVGVLSLAAHGCSFGKENGAAIQMNTCSIDSDCMSQHCKAGLCVTTESTKPREVTLEVTPQRMPDGSQPFPIVSYPFSLQGGNSSFLLHRPIKVPVRIHDSQRSVDRIEAMVTFRPKLESNFTTKATQINTVRSVGSTAPAEINVLLLAGVTYDVFVQPVDGKLPPYAEPFSVEDGAELDIDYSEIAWVERKFVFRNVPSSGFTVRAKVNGQTVSSSAPLNDGTVTLKFRPDDAAYKLELSATDQPVRSETEPAPCDQSDALIPTLNVDSAALVPEKKTPDLFYVDLPTLPQPVLYSGSVSLCANQKPSGNLPITLTANTVNFGTTGTTSKTPMVTGSYETSTLANWNQSDQRYEFCAPVVPGDYVIIVRPVATINCEIFAERRSLVTAEGEDITDAVLELRTPTTLGGSVLTPDQMPIANASIDLQALGTEGATLYDDLTVPLNNRSKSGTTLPDGSFRIPVDVGTYDVIIKPPSPSNFAWKVIYDVDVDSRTPPDAKQLTLDAPVVIKGALRYEGGSKAEQVTLHSADIHAYTMVDEGDKTARRVEIARSTADENGNVTLLMSPDLQKTWAQ